MNFGISYHCLRENYTPLTMTSELAPFNQSDSAIAERNPVELIRLESISKVYGKGEATVHALSNVHLSINQGEYCAIMGA